jgi:phospholipid/cholesterol/gamma-HCH transport system substrate-binding protein
MALTNDRNRFMISGAIGLVFVISLVTLGIKSSFGAFDGGYHLTGSFAAAGQGLLEGSDVKVRGVNVGEVDQIELVDNRAVITLRIEDRHRIPETVQAVIRPKTLFGEKFVDLTLGDDELSGPYLEDGGTIEDTLGGFELERVLAEAYPVIESIDPAELAVILDELATAGEGLGENINRSIVNGAVLTRLQASNDAEVRQFLGDLALLSEELDRLAPDLIAGAEDLNVALPTLNERGDQLNAALTEIAGLSSDVADLLENNREFTENALTNGSETLQILFDRRSQIQPLLLGIQRYTQTLAEAIRIEVGDGTLMAAVKNLVNVRETVEHAGGPELPPLPPLPVDPDDLLGQVPQLPNINDALDDVGGVVGGVLGGDRTGSTSGGGSSSLLDLLLGGGQR